MIGTYYGSKSPTTFSLPNLQKPDTPLNKYIIYYDIQNIPVVTLRPTLDIAGIQLTGQTTVEFR
jgi:microcystin-dependent protein